jgi:U4/U6 small nuclear ribonucleoprotein PRP31
MSLADELLADLEDDEEEEMAAAMDEEMDVGHKDEWAQKELLLSIKGSSEPLIKDVAKLYHSCRLKETVDKIKEFSGKPRKAEELQGPVEADPEYILIVDANNLAAEIDEEVAMLHKVAKDQYSKRFPELETLVVQPMEYLLTAKELKNNLEDTKNNPVLEQFLSQATIMVVSVTASTTQGTHLDSKGLNVIVEAAETAVALNAAKIEILAYVESRMAFIAPNLSSIVGASTAAKIMGAAGGLTALSKMPANNIALLGQQKKTQSGFSQASTRLPHTGFVYYSELVQNLPPDLRRKTSRIVGSKCALAARVDSFHESLNGSVGQDFLEEIEKKIEKMQEPPPVKNTKALPAPLEAPKKKRGGRRVRKQKERYAVTEMRKQANRMNFGELQEDVYQNDLGYSRGNIGKSGIGGGIRMAQIDERTKVRVSQTLKRNLQKEQATWGGSTTVKKHVSGTASSVAFTPLQGLEIVNPLAAEKRVDEANAKYFSPSAAFMKVKTPLP